jgi:glycine/sarcosine N-methyltransferase
VSDPTDDPNAAFYEGMSPHYHLLFDDWDAAVVEQGRVLDRLIAARHGPGPRRAVDAACGIGTQALGLARCGHDVLGTDLSAPALARAGREAARLGVRLPTRVADVRTLSAAVPERFDVAVVLDNALAHLLIQDELTAAARELAAVLVPGGLLLASIRDYDAIRAERRRFTSARVMGSGDGRRVAFQVWDWEDDGRSYGLTQYLVRHRADGVETLTFRSRIRAVARAALTAAFAAAELSDLSWIEPADSGFYQPILAARRP